MEEIPEITESDELQSFRQSTQQVLTVERNQSLARGYFGLVIGDRSAKTFEMLWQQVQKWKSFWHVTDGYKVYSRLIESIESSDHLVSRTHTTHESKMRTVGYIIT